MIIWINDQNQPRSTTVSQYSTLLSECTFIRGFTHSGYALQEVRNWFIIPLWSHFNWPVLQQFRLSSLYSLLKVGHKKNGLAFNISVRVWWRAWVIIVFLLIFLFDFSGLIWSGGRCWWLCMWLSSQPHMMFMSSSPIWVRSAASSFTPASSSVSTGV